MQDDCPAQRHPQGASTAESSEQSRGRDRPQERADTGTRQEQCRRADPGEHRLVTAYQDKDQQCVDTEHHAVRGQADERIENRWCADDGSRPVQPSGGHRVERRTMYGTHAVVGPQPVAGEAGCHPGRGRGRHDHQENNCGRTQVPGSESGAQHQHEVGTDEGGGGAHGGGYRVHGCDLIARYHVGQGRRQSRRHEASDAVDYQRAQQQHHIVGAERQLEAHQGHQQDADQIGADQDGAPVPAVQQCAGERTDRRIRQEQHRECPGDGPRFGLALRVEQQRARESGLEEAVAELSQEAHPHQPPEVGKVVDGAPQAQRRVARSHVSRFRVEIGLPNVGGGLCGVFNAHTTNV
ncbi:hypothetical protein MYAB104536_22440 [Mycobacteroides abscessus subsp. abscessus]